MATTTGPIPAQGVLSPFAMEARPRRAMAQVLSFNSQCPLHRRKCKVRASQLLTISRLETGLPWNFDLTDGFQCSFAVRARVNRTGPVGTPPVVEITDIATRSRGRLILRAAQHKVSGDQPNGLLVRAPVKAGWQPDHEQALRYFTTFAAADIRNYIPSTFWEDTVLRAAQEDRIVRYAIAAVSKAHQAYACSATSNYHALASYNTALAKLSGHLQRGHSSETVLVCCILIFTAERMLGHTETSYQHLRAGCTILQSELARQSSQSAHLDALSHVMLRLDAESAMIFRHSTLLSDLMPFTAHVSTETQAWLRNPKFSKLQAAARHFDAVVHAIWKWLPLAMSFTYRQVPSSEIPAEVFNTKRHLEQRLRTWKFAFDEFEWEHYLGTMVPSSSAMPDSFTQTSEQLSVLTLRAQHLVNDWTLADTLSERHTPRPFDTNPLKLIAIGEEALMLRQALETMREAHLPRSFSIHIGLPETLILLGHRTSYPAIRARSMNLVRAFRDLEGRKQVWRWIPIDWMDLKKEDELFLSSPGH